jgi:hypothetical protein
MKKIFIILVAVFSLFALESNAQWTNNGTDMWKTNSGNVGIGTATPARILSVAASNATVKIEDLDGDGASTIRDSYDPTWSTMQISKFATVGNAQISIDPRPSDGSSDAIFRFFRATNTTGNVGFYIHAGDGSGDVNTIMSGNGDSYFNLLSGGVGIGTETIPSGYKLAINGKAIVESLEVQLEANWPDYVFGDNFQLRSLHELEQFINENKHLPDVPSAEEMENSTLDLGKMNIILLQKVEELSLYVIQLQKEVDMLKEPGK